MPAEEALEGDLTEAEKKSLEVVGSPVYGWSKEDMKKKVEEVEAWWAKAPKEAEPPDVSILEEFCAGGGQTGGERLEEPGEYKGGQLPVMPRTIGLPTYAAVPERSKKMFPERPNRKPMIRLYCFPGAADNYMLWLGFATSAPEWCEVAVYEPRGHGFRPDEPWDRSLEERAADAFLVMRPAFETHAKGGVSEGAPFAFLSHGVGSHFLALIAYRLKQELSLEPLVVFANDGPPPTQPTLTPEGYKLMCKDPYKFYKVFQPDTARQIDKLGKTSKQGKALLQKWWRSMRMFEEHTYRVMAKRERDGEPFHKFGCDLWVLVARHTVDMELGQSQWPEAFKKEWFSRKPITASNPDSALLWDRDGFKKWEEWTEEDFYYRELEVDHGGAKNSVVVQNVVFKELAGFCGMDYKEVA